MAIAIQHKRGVAANLPVLVAGEFYYATDTGQLYVGPTPSIVGQYSGASVADQTINAATTALLTGSLLAIPVGKLRIGTAFRYTFSVSKTAAGTAANTFNFRLGTLGTASDPSICAFALPVGTGVVDVGKGEIVIIVRGPLSSLCVAQGSLSLIHNLAATGLATIPCVCINTLSGTFDATVASLKASLSCTTAALTVLTFQQVLIETWNLR